ncbi:hypothetical protein ACEWY4_013786 [Coilia grayii]|uniref:Protein shisa-5 n=1 Tax=Coilia grayii TaxID=363190 RepID=A0ABD1JXE0_9TELE
MALVIYVLVFFGTLLSVSADDDCQAYYKNGQYQHSRSCFFDGFCCGTCNDRYCCSSRLKRLTEEQQDVCYNDDEVYSVKYVEVSVIIASAFIAIMTVICCCVCPCCCLYKMCRKPRPVIATTTHTTTVVTTPYPQNTAPAQQYPGYHPVAPQPGYGTPLGYGAQPMPSAPHQGQATAFGPPPPYQDIAGPGYPVNYGGAAFTPGQQAYPLQPPVPAGYQTQPSPATDFNAQPAYNPDFVAPPVKPAY